MTVKHKVGEIAKDLNLVSKDIIKVLDDELNVKYKISTVLTDDELDFVFDYFTKDCSVLNFDDYFSKRKSISNPPDGDIKSILDAYKSKVEDSEKIENVKTIENKEIIKKNIFQKKDEVSLKKISGETKVIKEIEEHIDTTTKLINTKNENLNAEKYNEKYEVIANSNKNVTVKNSFAPNKQKIHHYKKQNKRRETENERLARIVKERKLKQLTISIPDKISVGELALKLKASASQVIKKLIELGSMNTVNDVIDFETANLVSMEFHTKVNLEVKKTVEEMVLDEAIDNPEDLKPRMPIVVVMGHVDHGKTSLLDRIRKTSVVNNEAGGITQKIGAYEVKFNNNRITFLDTPGHEAFTSLRGRGARITDIAILVIAADDGVMPQTIEAINHAKEANVTIIVAVSKIDKPGANKLKILQQLAEHEIVPEEWGGTTPCVGISSKTGEGIDELLGLINLVAEINDLKANFNRNASGVVLEVRLDKGSGPVATLIVLNGTLKRSDLVVAGTAIGRIRTLTSCSGKKILSAGPSHAVEVTGLDTLPLGGEKFNVVTDEKLAKQLVSERKSYKNNERQSSEEKITFENLFSHIEKNNITEFKIILKTDVDGSLKALKNAIESINIEGEENIRARVIHSAVGGIKESDINLAQASDAVIIGFNVVPNYSSINLAKTSFVQIKLYKIIYDCINDVREALSGMLKPKTREIELGIAQCRKVFKVTGVGMIAGCYVKSGKIERGALAQVIRDLKIISEDKIESIRKVKDDVKEVASGFECGIKLSHFSDIKVSDEIRVYKLEVYK